MKTIAFNKEKTQAIGYVTDGEFVPLGPVPEGDAFDDLVLDSSRAVLTRSKLREKVNGFSRIHSELLRDSETPSQRLLEKIQAWIQQGTLRDVQQVNAAVTEWLHWAERLTALGVFTNGLDGAPAWRFDFFAVHQLGWFFGMPGAKPLPSKTEILAERAQTAQREAERQQKSAADRREEEQLMEQWEAERVKKEHIKTLTKKMAATIYFYDQNKLEGLNYSDREMELPKEFLIAQSNRSAYRRFNTEEVAALVDAGETDTEIVEEMIMKWLEAARNVVTPDLNEIPPLKEGELRKWLTPAEYKAFCNSDEYWELLDSFEMSVTQGKEELYCVTLSPQAPLSGPEKEAAFKAAEETKARLAAE